MAPFRSTRCALGRVRRSVDAELPRSTPFRPVGQSTLDMMKINPSLMFSGACGDAFRRYASLFGGEGRADGGDVLMPLRATHWSPRDGVVRDPFGIRWEIDCDAAIVRPAP